jgi:hypothetical protein
MRSGKEISHLHLVSRNERPSSPSYKGLLDTDHYKSAIVFDDGKSQDGTLTIRRAQWELAKLGEPKSRRDIIRRQKEIFSLAK